MAIFITQGRYTQAALDGMLAKPENRGEAVAKLYEAAGAKMLGYYVTFGEYDFLIVGEGPSADLQPIFGALVAAASGGGATNLKTTVGMTSADAVKGFEAAGRIAGSFRSAGAV